MQQTTIEPQLLTIQQVMKQLNVSRSSVERLIRNKKLEVVKIGRAVRVEQDDLDRFIASQRRGKAS